MEDFDNLPQLQQQQPGEEAELKEGDEKTLPDDFSTHCTVTSGTDGGGGGGGDTVQLPCEGDLGAVRLLGGCNHPRKSMRFTTSKSWTPRDEAANDADEANKAIGVYNNNRDNARCHQCEPMVNVSHHEDE